MERALYWYTKAADGGEEVANYNLGVCYELGIGVEKDESKAFDFYQKSAENGDMAAKFQLGYCYVNGIGTDIDKDKGVELYNEAAGMQDETDEKADDLNKVNYWFQKASEGNNKVALYKLGEFYESDILDEKANGNYNFVVI